MGLEGAGHRAQDFVTSGVAIPVVETLEMVEVHEDDGEWAIFAAGTAQFAVEGLLHEAAVEEAGEGIADGLFAERFAKAQAGERKRDLAGDGGGEALLRLLQGFEGFGAFGAFAAVILHVEKAEGFALSDQRHTEIAGGDGMTKMRANDTFARIFAPVRLVLAEGEAFGGSEDGLGSDVVAPRGHGLQGVFGSGEEEKRAAGRDGQDVTHGASDDGERLGAVGAGLEDGVHLVEHGHLHGTELQLGDEHVEGFGVLPGFAGRFHLLGNVDVDGIGSRAMAIDCNGNFVKFKIDDAAIFAGAAHDAMGRGYGAFGRAEFAGQADEGIEGFADDFAAVVEEEINEGIVAEADDTVFVLNGDGQGIPFDEGVEEAGAFVELVNDALALGDFGADKEAGGGDSEHQ